MSRYDLLRREGIRLRIRQAICSVLPAAAIVASLIYYLPTEPRTAIVVSLATLIALVFVLHRLWRAMFRPYREWFERSCQIEIETKALRSQVATIFSKYPTRRKGEQFKRTYNLAGRQVRDLEQALSVGMHRERREVFVTVFVRAGIAVRVTASIGSPFRCSASDDPTRWGDHVERLGCDAIFQYHNHPMYNGITGPSDTDYRCSKALMRVLGSHSAKLRSFVICWNDIGEWRVFEYDGLGRHWLHYEFDVAL